MSDTAAAIRAAREVQADILAPELFRQASEWFMKAKREYKLKNFNFAQTYCQKARRLAEQSELEAVRSGANRTDQAGTDPYADPTVASHPVTTETSQQQQPTPYEYPTPTGTPAENFSDQPAPTSSNVPSESPVPSP